MDDNDEYAAKDPHGPRRIGERVQIAGDSDRTVYAWKSTRGLCLAVVAPQDQGASGCGFPVIGTPHTTFNQPKPEHVIGWMFGRMGDSQIVDIEGVVSKNVASVQIELRDGRLITSPIYRAPRELDLIVNFFFTQVSVGPQRVENGRPVQDVISFRAYDSEGSLLERFTFTSQ